MRSISIIFGGNTIESEYSVKAAMYLKERIADSFRISLINIDSLFRGENWEVVKDSDCVINLLYGTPGQEGLIPLICESIGTPYIGTDQFGSSLVKNKTLSKIIAEKNGVKVPRTMIIDKEKDMVFPVIVKPNQRGGLSLGISYCETRGELHAAIEKAKQYDQSILIEEYIQGREYSVCAIEMGTDLKILPFLEILKETKICDYETKQRGLRKVTSATFSEEMENKFQRIVRKLFRAFSLKDYAYFDFMVSNNDIYFIEAGVVPGFTPNSNLPISLKKADISCADFFNDRIEAAICRR